MDKVKSLEQDLYYNYTNMALRTNHAQYSKLITIPQLSVKLIGIQGNI